MVKPNVKPSSEGPEKKARFDEEIKGTGFTKASVEIIKISREEGKVKQVNEIPIDEKQQVKDEEVNWFNNNKDSYAHLISLYNKLNMNLHINNKSIMILRDLEKVLGELICTTNVIKYGPSEKVCRMLANLIYKTTKPENLKDSQLNAIYNCLSFVINENCTHENYLEASKILAKANLNWITGDKEYR